MDLMEIEFIDDKLDKLETDANYTLGLSQQIVRGFRKTMQILRSAEDERDLAALRGLRYEKLKGTRSHQRSVRINQQWRLILELEGKGVNKKVKVIGIEDYH